MKLTELLYMAQSIPKESLNVPKDNLSQSTLGSILQFVFAITGAAAVIIIMLAALKYVTSQGNPQDTAQAKNTIIYAVVGLIICIAAFAIVRFVVNAI